MKFEDLELVPEVLQALSAAGYTEPTPIQAQAIPPALLGRDVLGCAQTGTGKTAAFCVPALQHADQTAGDDAVLRTLILTPTRELAAQINDSLKTYSKGLDLWHTVIFGGVKEKPQIDELKRGIDILVATPGRLLDLMNRGFVSLKSIELFVLDEADRMLDMGFIHDVRRVTKALPAKRQTMFFSATMPPAIRELADNLLNNPAVVTVDPVSSTVDTVEQSVYKTDKRSKRALLSHLMQDGAWKRVVVFTRTKHGANRVTKHLDGVGISAAAIHGNKAQNARTRALEGFRNGEIRVLVATDIAARGIDVEGVSHVVNFDIPNIPETYVHRIGRTGRAGRSGIAVSLCEHDEDAYLRGVERLITKRIPLIEEHPFPRTPGGAPSGEDHETREGPPPNRRRGGGGAGRPRGPRPGGNRGGARSRAAARRGGSSRGGSSRGSGSGPAAS